MWHKSAEISWNSQRWQWFKSYVILRLVPKAVGWLAREIKWVKKEGGTSPHWTWRWKKLFCPSKSKQNSFSILDGKGKGPAYSPLAYGEQRSFHSWNIFFLSSWGGIATAFLPRDPAQSIKVGQKRWGWPDLWEGETDSHSTELKSEDHSLGFPIMANRKMYFTHSKDVSRWGEKVLFAFIAG